MTEEEIYNLYILQSRNVRKLKKVQASIKRTINLHLKKNEEFQVELNTKLYALLYCTLSEAQFIQILNTPKGFSYNEIEQIKAEKKRNGIVKGWEYMLDSAFDKVSVTWRTNQDLCGRRAELQEITDTYIKEPSELRNKIAHGQWDFALNSNNTAENVPRTHDLKALTFTQITIWNEVHQYLGLIVRDLIQSPKIGFHNRYWENLVKLNGFLEKSKNWTVQRHKTILRPVKKYTCTNCGHEV